MAAKQFPEKYRNYIVGLLTFFRDLTGHGEYELTVRFSTKDSEDDGVGKGTIMAKVSTDVNYLNTVVTIYPSIYEDYQKKNYKDIARYMLHEICHIFIDPVTEIYRDDLSPSDDMHLQKTIERQVQRIRNTISNRLDSEFKDEKNQWYSPEYILGRMVE